jgi:hypothetical protein
VNQTSRLEVARWETERHAHTLRTALQEWDGLPSQPWSTLETNAALVRLLDQILYRFLKLQDAVGERLLPATLAELAEPSDDWPMRDRLDRLERLGFLDTTQWLAWRGVRNRLAHEYPDMPEMRWAALRDALDSAHALLGCVAAWLIKLPPAFETPQSG